MAKPVVYVAHISNLSEARYCAGMGVDLLGFVIDPDAADFVSATDYQGMAGWLAGPLRVVQSRQRPDNNQLEAYKPDFIHLADTVNGHSLLQGVNAETSWIITRPDQKPPSDRDPHVQWLLDITNWKGSVRELLLNTGADGIMLSGQKEDQPGLASYDHLASVLEEIQEMDEA